MTRLTRPTPSCPGWHSPRCRAAADRASARHYCLPRRCFAHRVACRPAGDGDALSRLSGCTPRAVGAESTRRFTSFGTSPHALHSVPASLRHGPPAAQRPHPAGDGEIKGTAPVGRKASRNQRGTAGCNSASRAAFLGKARQFIARRGTAQLSKPSRPTIACCGVRFGRSVSRCGRP
jgi:hypothetical protein